MTTTTAPAARTAQGAPAARRVRAAQSVRAARHALGALAAAALLALPAQVAAQASSAATGQTPPAGGSAGGTSPNHVTQPMTVPSGASARTDARAGSLSLHHVDRRFAARALADGLAEIELGRLAAQQGQSEAVRRFGQRMADEHARANERLAALAQARGIVLPDSPDPVQQAARARLERLSGDAFDRAYARNQIDSHRRAIQRHEGEASGGRDAELQRFAADALPTLREHLRAARALPGQARAGASSAPARDAAR